MMSRHVHLLVMIQETAVSLMFALMAFALIARRRATIVGILMTVVPT